MGFSSKDKFIRWIGTWRESYKFDDKICGGDSERISCNGSQEEVF